MPPDATSFSQPTTSSAQTSKAEAKKKEKATNPPKSNAKQNLKPDNSFSQPANKRKKPEGEASQNSKSKKPNIEVGPKQKSQPANEPKSQTKGTEKNNYQRSEYDPFLALPVEDREKWDLLMKNYKIRGGKLAKMSRRTMSLWPVKQRRFTPPGAEFVFLFPLILFFLKSIQIFK